MDPVTTLAGLAWAVGERVLRMIPPLIGARVGLALADRVDAEAKRIGTDDAGQALKSLLDRWAAGRTDQLEDRVCQNGQGGAEPMWMKRFAKSLRRNVTEIERRTDLSADEKVSHITRICSGVCAIMVPPAHGLMSKKMVLTNFVASRCVRHWFPTVSFRNSSISGPFG